MISKLSKTARSLIIANILGGILALLYGWDVGQIMLAYWLENLAIGLINVVKMIVVGFLSVPEDATANGKPFTRNGHIGLTLFTVPFFLVHYGGFLTGHGVFLAAMFESNFSDIRTVLIMFIPLLAHHIYSFVFNFIGRKEYENRMVMMQMFSPYARVVVLHVAIIFGGALLMFSGSGLLGVAILVVGKIIVDTGLHNWSHKGKSNKDLEGAMKNALQKSNKTANEANKN